MNTDPNTVMFTLTRKIPGEKGNKNREICVSSSQYISCLGLVAHLGLGGEEDSDDEAKEADGATEDLHNQNLKKQQHFCDPEDLHNQNLKKATAIVIPKISTIRI